MRRPGASSVENWAYGGDHGGVRCVIVAWLVKPCLYFGIGAALSFACDVVGGPVLIPVLAACPACGVVGGLVVEACLAPCASYQQARSCFWEHGL